MSRQALDGFRARLNVDHALREEMTRALDEKASLEAVAAFANARGYDVSADDLRSVLELSDEQLDAVAGGAGSFKGELVGIEPSWKQGKQDRHEKWIELLSYG
jgi:predicted ribosomally synthesized peptide with nif11-like leader